MQKHTLLFFVPFLFCVLLCKAQTPITNPEAKRTNIWYFGDKAGLDFSSGTPVPLEDSEMSVLEGSSVISDKNGNLLFYTDGVTVWNKNHTVMPNGTGLFGTETPIQSSVVIPKPLNDSIYYIFTCGFDDTTPTPIPGMYYSEVNIKLAGGNGDITSKNNLLMANTSYEALGAVKHANNCDVWVMGHEKWGNNFYTFLITKDGVNTTPTIQNIGYSPVQALCGNSCGKSYIKFSPDGKKMVTSNFWNNFGATPQYFYTDTLELYRFNNSTGNLSNLVKIYGDTTYVGLSFSPDSKKLYASTMNDFDNIIYLVQYDISTLTNNAILNSKVVLYSPPNSQENTPTQIQIGKDGKLYICRGLNLPPFYYTNLSVIEKPNEQGLACNFILGGQDLGTKGGLYGLPNFVETYFLNENTTCYPIGINERGFEPKPLFYVAENNTDLIVLIGKNITNNYTFTLYNLLGNEIKIQNIVNNNSEIKFTINKNEIKQQLIIIKAQNTQSYFTQKIIIN